LDPASALASSNAARSVQYPPRKEVLQDPSPGEASPPSPASFTVNVGPPPQPAAKTKNQITKTGRMILVPMDRMLSTDREVPLAVVFINPSLVEQIIAGFASTDHNPKIVLTVGSTIF